MARSAPRLEVEEVVHLTDRGNAQGRLEWDVPAGGPFCGSAPRRCRTLNTTCTSWTPIGVEDCFRGSGRQTAEPPVHHTARCWPAKSPATGVGTAHTRQPDIQGHSTVSSLTCASTATTRARSGPRQPVARPTKCSGSTSRPKQMRTRVSSVGLRSPLSTGFTVCQDGPVLWATPFSERRRCSRSALSKRAT